MKKLFPIAVIALFGAMSFVSCSKSSSSASCTCTFPINGKDTSYAFPTNTTVTCAEENTIIQLAYPTGGCK